MIRAETHDFCIDGRCGPVEYAMRKKYEKGICGGRFAGNTGSAALQLFRLAEQMSGFGIAQRICNIGTQIRDPLFPPGNR